MKKYQILNLFLTILIILGTIYFAIFRYESSRLLTYLAIIPLLLAPFLLKKTKYKLTPKEHLLYLFFIWLAYFLGCVVNLYNKISWFDTFVHFLSGIFTFYIGILITTKKEEKASISFAYLFCLSFTMLIAGLWEIFEFTMDQFLSLNLQHSTTQGVTDTMKDIIAALLGSLSLLFIINIKKESKNK